MKLWNKITVGVLTVVMLVICLVLIPVNTRAAEVASGTCGDALVWSLDDGGTLTVSGTGDMSGYSTASKYPWYSYRSSITSLVIEEGVTGISAFAFRNQTNLTTVSLPESLQIIRGNAFSGCGKLQSITLPDSITSFAGAVFLDCTSLTEVSLPPKITEIQTNTFNGCTKLKTVSIPAGVTAIGVNAFEDCTALTHIYFGGSPEKWAAISVETGNDPLSTATVHTVLGSGTCGTDVTWVLDGEGVLTISGSGAMRSYGSESYVPWYSHRSAIVSVVVKEGVTTVGAYAFKNCTKLTKVTLPQSVTQLGNYSFADCTVLQNLSLPQNVTQLGDYCFAGCSSLKTMLLPDSITQLGYAAFKDCVRLTSIRIPEGITTLPSYLFYNCSSLTALTIPQSVTTSLHSTFDGCSSLTSLTIPKNLTTLYSIPFSGCSSLTGIWVDEENPNYSSDSQGVLYNKDQTTLLRVPQKFRGSFMVAESVTEIGNSAFADCKALTGVTLPQSITQIGWGVFSGCTGLTDITLPEGLESIYVWAFKGCGLTSITIPKSVTDIHSEAFTGCTALRDIYFQGTPTIRSDSFSNVTANAYLSIEAASLQQADYGGNITWIPGSYVLQVKEDAPYWYDLGQTLDTTAVEVITTYTSGRVDRQTLPASAYGSYDNSTLGQKKVIVTVGAYETVYTYAVVDKENLDIGQVDVSCERAIPYTGSEICPEPAVTYQKIQLRLGKDYTLSYSNNIAVGSNAKITVIGKGLFEGFTGSCSYAVVKADIRNASASVADCVYDAAQQTPAVTVNMNDQTLTEGTDYIVQYFENIAIGDGTALARVVGIGNYCGSKDLYFSITNDNRNITLKGNRWTVGSQTFYSSTITMGPGWLKGVFNSNQKLTGSYTLTDLSTGRVLAEESTMPLNYAYYNYFRYDFSSVYHSSNQLESYLLVYNWLDYDGNAYAGKLTIIVSSGPVDADSFTLKQAQADTPWHTYLETEHHWATDLPAILWSSSDESIATVEDGIVTWHQPGTVTITAYSPNKKLSDTIVLTKKAADITQAQLISYDIRTGEATAVYEGFRLTQDSDYTVSVQPQGKLTVVTFTGCGLFAGAESRTFYTETGLPVVCSHSYTNDYDAYCNGCDYVRDLSSLYPIGDYTQDRQVNNEDVVYLLWHTLFSEDYPIMSNADFTGDGMVTNEDVVYLLWHTLFPEDYPI